MSEEIPRDRNKELTAFIDDFLRDADLSTVSVKKVRTYLQTKVNYEIVPYKSALSALIQQRFDQILQEVEADGTRVEPKEEEYEAPSKPASKATSSRKSKSTVDEDARFAAKLQAELNSSTRTRTTRGAKAAPTKRKTTKKKSAARIEDSEGEEGAPKKKRKINRNNPFNALQVLSEPLSQLTGETRLSRPETVKRIWAYVKQNDLQDPADKRYIICDARLAPIFTGVDRIHMFKMNKVLSAHFSPLPPGEKQPTNEEEIEATESASVSSHSDPVSPSFSNVESDIKEEEVKAE